MRKSIGIAAVLLLGVAGCSDKGAGEAAAAKPATGIATKAPAPAPPRDWTQVTARTPSGGFVMGNPDAKVKFLEFASLTCPHCRDFNKESMTGIRAYVATGKVSYEFRNFILGGQDLAISVAARCQTPPAFFRSVDALYATQSQWIQNYAHVTPEQGKAIEAMPRDRQLIAIADLGKMDEFFRLRGMPRAKYEACLKDENNVKQLQAIGDEAVKKYGLTGTPTFVLNGETKPDLHVWKDVDAAIKAMIG